MLIDFNKLSDRHLVALHRCAKKRLYAVFKDPKAMIALRNVLEKRGLL